MKTPKQIVFAILKIVFDVKYPQNKCPKNVGINAPLQWKYPTIVDLTIFAIESNLPPYAASYPMA